MKKTNRTFRGIITKFLPSLILALVLTAPVSIYACTGVYVGKDASADGSLILARANDLQTVCPSHLVIVPAEKDKPGRTMPIGLPDGITVPIPKDTYGYRGTPIFSVQIGEALTNYDFAVCTNDQGVAITATVTAYANNAALSADPYTEDGLREDSLAQLVACQVSSARQGVEYIASIMDKYGLSSSSEALMIADASEAWYMELYTGHQYAAVRLPSDKVAVFGNEFSLQYLSDYEDSITSKKLESLAKTNGFAVYGKNNELNVLATYSGQEVVSDYSHMRTWIGHETLAKEKYGDYDKNQVYDFTFEPKGRISITDVQRLMRNHFDGTPFDPYANDLFDQRIISTETSLSVHIVQLFPDLPEELRTVIWYCSGPAACGVFVPFSNACTSVSSSYAGEQTAGNITFDTQTYPYYASKACTALAVTEFDAYAKPIQQYWKKAEKKITASYARMLKESARIYKSDPDKAVATVTDFCNTMQEMAFADQKAILDQLLFGIGRNSNVFQLAKDPETGERIPGVRRVLSPLKVDLSAKKYRLFTGK